MTGRKEACAPRAIRYRAQGLCGCGRPPKPGCKSCALCMVSCRESTKARRKLPGHCRDCGVVSDGRCDKCRETKRKRDKQRRARRRANGLCSLCGKLATDGVLCARHADAGRERSKLYQRAKRAVRP